MKRGCPSAPIADNATPERGKAKRATRHGGPPCEEEDEESVRSIGPPCRSCHPPQRRPVAYLAYSIPHEDETSLSFPLNLHENCPLDACPLRRSGFRIQDFPDGYCVCPTAAPTLTARFSDGAWIAASVPITRSRRRAARDVPLFPTRPQPIPLARRKERKPGLGSALAARRRAGCQGGETDCE